MTGIPTFEIGSGAQPARQNLEQWRIAVTSLFDIEPVRDDFQASISSFALGNLLVGQSTASAQMFRRDEAVIQRSQIDHMMVQLYITGGFAGHADGTPIAVEAGDICCFDLAFGFATEADDFSNITLIIPKSALQPLTKGDHFHGMILKSGDTANFLLGAHMRELLRLCPNIEPAEIESVTQVTAEVVRICLRMPRRQRLAPEAGTGSLVERAKSLIGENLGDPDLDGRMICEAIGISRATLYRHFEPFGGVASVIRNWRLSNVFGELERNRREPIQAIVRRNGFRSGSTFARAFKSRYGISPSDFRSMRTSMAEDRGGGVRDGSNAANPADLTLWMRQLGQFGISPKS